MARLMGSRALLSASSLGASGGVLSIVALFAYHFPKAEIGLIFLPMVPIPISYAVPALVAFDTLGMKKERASNHLGQA